MTSSRRRRDRRFHSVIRFFGGAMGAFVLSTSNVYTAGAITCPTIKGKWQGQSPQTSMCGSVPVNLEIGYNEMLERHEISGTVTFDHRVRVIKGYWPDGSERLHLQVDSPGNHYVIEGAQQGDCSIVLKLTPGQCPAAVLMKQ